MLASSMAWGLGFSVRSMIMRHLGSDATAASSITSVVQELVTCLCKGVTTGTGIMIGKQLGQNKLEVAKQYGREFRNVSIWTDVFNVLLLCLAGPITIIFFVLTDTARHYLIWMLVLSDFYLVGYSFNSVIV